MPCIEWDRARNKAGYGVVWDPVLRKTRLAHRVAAWAMDGDVVLHICDNPSCVNPEHLRIGTHADNRADCVAKGRGNSGEVNGMSVLTEELVAWARESAQSDTEVARCFGCSRSSINMLRNYKTWRKNATHQPDD